jgi:stage II sporulation protein M
MLKKRFSDEKNYDGFFTGLYKRNEMFLIASAATFFGSLFIGYFLSGILDQLLAGTLKSFQESVNNGEIKLTTLSIFMNNLKVSLTIYAGGIIFGILTVGFLFFNGLFVGYAASKFPIGDFIIYTLPHGIFEISGLIIAGAAGFRLANTIINVIRDILNMKRYMPVGGQIKEILNINYWEFRESLTLFAIAIVLIFIAAIIEANFTIAWGNYIKSVI